MEVTAREEAEASESAFAEADLLEQEWKPEWKLVETRLKARVETLPLPFPLSVVHPGGSAKTAFNFQSLV